VSPVKSIFCGIFWGCAVVAALVWGGTIDAIRGNKASAELQAAQRRIATLEDQLAAAAKSIRPDCGPLQSATDELETLKAELETLKTRVRATIDTPPRPGALRAAVNALRSLVYPPGAPELSDEFGCIQ
jgi:type VI protein secretion system component VasK